MERFAYPKSWKRVAFVGVPAACYLFFNVLDTWIWEGSHTDYLEILGFLAKEFVLAWLAYVCIAFLLRANDEFEISDDGIAVFSRRGRRFIPWTEIAEIRWRGFKNRMEFYDTQGTRMLIVIAQFTYYERFPNFERFQDLVLSKTSLRQASRREFTTSRRLRQGYIVAGIFFVLAFLWVVSMSYRDAMLLFLAAMLIDVFGYIRNIKTISIEEDRICVKGILATKIIRFDEVTDVNLMTYPAGAGMVQVEHGKRNRTGFLFVQEGTPALYLSILEAWKQYIDATQDDEEGASAFPNA